MYLPYDQCHHSETSPRIIGRMLFTILSKSSWNDLILLKTNMKNRSNNFCLLLMTAALQDARGEVLAGHSKNRGSHLSLPRFVCSLPYGATGGLTPGATTATFWFAVRWDVQMSEAIILALLISSCVPLGKISPSPQNPLYYGSDLRNSFYV